MKKAEVGSIWPERWRLQLCGVESITAPMVCSWWRLNERPRLELPHQYYEACKNSFKPWTVGEWLLEARTVPIFGNCGLQIRANWKIETEIKIEHGYIGRAEGAEGRLYGLLELDVTLLELKWLYEKKSKDNLELITEEEAKSGFSQRFCLMQDYWGCVAQRLSSA